VLFVAALERHIQYGAARARDTPDLLDTPLLCASPMRRSPALLTRRAGLSKTYFQAVRQRGGGAGKDVHEEFVGGPGRGRHEGTAPKVGLGDLITLRDVRHGLSSCIRAAARRYLMLT